MGNVIYRVTSLLTEITQIGDISAKILTLDPFQAGNDKKERPIEEPNLFTF